MNLIIMGAGHNGAFYLNNCVLYSRELYENVYFFDNNEQLWGKKICNILVLNKSEFVKAVEKGARIVIAANAWRELYKQCWDMKIESAVIDIISRENNPYSVLEDNVFSKYGYARSVALKKSVDCDGRPLPWFTYPAIEYLNDLDLSDKTVFEFGCGQSSLYWAERAKKCISVENNSEWYKYCSQYENEKLEIELCPNKEEYASFIEKKRESFDIVVIDGRWRDLCAEKAIKSVKASGIIILDNSDRVGWDEEYKKAIDYIRSLDFIQIDFNGMGPVSSCAWTTSFFISRNMDFKRLEKKIPIGGLDNN